MLYLYKFRESLNGKYLLEEVEEFLNEIDVCESAIRVAQVDIDVCEIKIIDSDDYMLVQWKREGDDFMEGVVFPLFDKGSGKFLLEVKKLGKKALSNKEYRLFLTEQKHFDWSIFKRKKRR